MTQRRNCGLIGPIKSIIKNTTGIQSLSNIQQRLSNVLESLPAIPVNEHLCWELLIGGGGGGGGPGPGGGGGGPSPPGPGGLMGGSLMVSS